MTRLHCAVPKVRFKGFSGDWKEKKLGDIAKIVGGGTPDTNNPDFWDGNINWFSPIEIGNSVYVNTSNRKITELGYKKSSARLLPAHKTILFTSRAGIGNMAILTEEASTNQGFQSLVIDEKNCSVYFVYSMGNFIKNKALKIASGSTFLEISGKALGHIKQSFPFLKEQTQIGNFFQKLDEVIEFQQKKFEQIQTYKKAMLQKMFPQQSETVPKIRFKGFDEDWKEKKLETITNRFDNQRVPITASERVLGSTPYYGANGIQDYVEGFTHDDSYILIAEDGANDLNNYPIQYVSGKIWVNNHVHVLSAKKNMADTKFLSFVLKTINFNPYLVGGGRAKLNAHMMMNIKVKITSLKEQTQIGNFFQKLDDLVEQYKIRLEIYQTLKKAMLQRLFV